LPFRVCAMTRNFIFKQVFKRLMAAAMSLETIRALTYSDSE
jgi:hypothetical protein